MRRGMPEDLCRCGHPFLSHDHLRRGTDCVWCTTEPCDRFSPPTVVSRMIAKLRRTSGPHASGSVGDHSPRPPVLALVR